MLLVKVNTATVARQMSHPGRICEGRLLGYKIANKNQLHRGEIRSCKIRLEMEPYNVQHCKITRCTRSFDLFPDTATTEECMF